MYKPEHFGPYEFVPRKVYQDRREKSFQLIDNRLLSLADYLRNQFGPITVNDWYWGGGSQWRGLRTPDSPYYSPYSQHTFGRALDMVFSDHSAQEVRDWLKDNFLCIEYDLEIYTYTVEEGVSWLHIDLRNNEKGYNSFWP